MKLYASIYIGTYETTLKVFQVTQEKTLKEIDCQRMPMELLTEAHATGYISKETAGRLCNILEDMYRTIRTYKVTDYQVYASVMFQSVINEFFVLEQIKLRTGLNVVVLSNSEQRFLSYRAAASQQEFEDMIAENAAIVDVGGASLQITLFVHGKVRTTQHIPLGTVMVRENMKKLAYSSTRREQVEEMMHKELDVFVSMYLKGTDLQYLVILGEVSSVTVNVGTKVGNGVTLKGSTYLTYLHGLCGKSVKKLPEELLLLIDNEDLMEPYLLLHKAIAEKMPAKRVYFPGVTTNDGMAYDYLTKKKCLNVSHDFEQDIISAAWAIARRCDSYQPHLKALDNISTQIFDIMKKYHGLGKRERLLMRVIAILHDCGKYISLSEASNCSYTVIKSTEILGLTHTEREMVATTVSMNRQELLPYRELADRFGEEEYMTVVKLLAILRVANALDRSHKQKMKHVKMSLRGDRLHITIETRDSLALEKGMFEEKADFFERVFSIRPELKEMRILDERG
jgi:exopolyphosphatase/guanosine-5'-triphosphate,3'-diphosphate pyrophosphatase